MTYANRMGALTYEHTALLEAVEESYDHLPNDGLDDARLHEMIARVAYQLNKEAAPDIGDWMHHDE